MKNSMKLNSTNKLFNKNFKMPYNKLLNNRERGLYGKIFNRGLAVNNHQTHAMHTYN